MPEASFRSGPRAIAKAPARRAGAPARGAAALGRVAMPCACGGGCPRCEGGSRRDRIVALARVEADGTDEAPTGPSVDAPEAAPEPADEGGAPAGGATGGAAATPCDPQPFARADYLLQPGTSPQDFGLTVLSGTVAVPRVQTRRVSGGVVLQPTAAAMPPITSVYTAAGTFIEGEAIVPDGDECPPGRYPLQWTLTAEGAARIRDGEIEHCADFHHAFAVSLQRYADIVNRLAAARTVFASDTAASRRVTRLAGAAPADWSSVFHCLAHRTEERDDMRWHTPRLNQVPPRSRTGCAFARAILHGTSFPAIGLHDAASVVAGCGEGGGPVPARRRGRMLAPVALPAGAVAAAAVSLSSGLASREDEARGRRGWLRTRTDPDFGGGRYRDWDADWARRPAGPAQALPAAQTEARLAEQVDLLRPLIPEWYDTTGMATFDSNFYRDPGPFDFRGREMTGWEVNYYFVSMAFAHQGWDWNEAQAMIWAWNASQSLGVNPWGGGGDMTDEMWFAAHEGFADEQARMASEGLGGAAPSPWR